MNNEKYKEEIRRFNDILNSDISSRSKFINVELILLNLSILLLVAFNVYTNINNSNKVDTYILIFILIITSVFFLYVLHEVKKINHEYGKFTNLREKIITGYITDITQIKKEYFKCLYNPHDSKLLKEKPWLKEYV